MHKHVLSIFGNYKKRIEKAITALQSHQGIILIDNKNRENEGDLVFSCENMTIQQMALAIRYGSGIVCLCITEKKRKKLDLPMMVKKNTSVYNTGFTISIEAAYGVSTGVSAKDRLTTIKTALPDQAQPSDFNRPGHIFPICAHTGGILLRPGHTEASITLMRLAGFKPMSVICELTNKDGSMAQIKDIIKFSKLNNMPVLTIDDIILYLTKYNIHNK
ncbi:3,4-dihydroxy-2-butanone-4-phosphate synthase [Buchnera aphidicola]|uniref:3,4-dihydroxy-2-butanone 4-phosphate synthase n=1 Tax=Buchnera aphidicola (Sarucallis kahawaluokalani) TaxID=1241878 RepID=A0A4D6YCE2_9GAMM|nr:3,4-dihydroxy-2-butanone-4-phosphate synthase [Buchnera aphidicola]QCI25853.1 3,4-dihydroxy-2-butanone-4-phosphate synthase [Buchnera aphidicola (Sarucallis kahawaluokalani)]